MENKDLICPVCGRFGKFDGKSCKRCGSYKKYNKFVYERYQPLINEILNKN